MTDSGFAFAVKFVLSMVASAISGCEP